MWNDEKRMSFTEHLGELRDRIIRSAIAFAASVLLCYIFSDQIFNVIAAPLLAEGEAARVLLLREAADSDDLLTQFLESEDYTIQSVDPVALFAAALEAEKLAAQKQAAAPASAAGEDAAAPVPPTVTEPVNQIQAILPVLKKGRFAVVVSEDRFGDATAVDLMHLLEANEMVASVIVMCPPSDPSAGVEAIKAGAHDLLLQPVTSAALRGKVQAALEESGFAGKSARVPWIALDPFEGIMTKIKLAIAGGLLIAFPYILWHICGFIFPGLHSSERRVVQVGIVGCGILATVGVCFAYFGIIPVVLPFIAQWMPADVELNFQLSKTVLIIIKALLVFGVVFQFPMAVLVLVYLGILTPESLRQHRKMSIVGLAFLSAIFTPPDPQTMILMMIPMLALYEMSIWLSYLVVWRQAKNTAEKEA